MKIKKEPEEARVRVESIGVREMSRDIRTPED